MRSADEIKELVTIYAKSDDRIRAVLLNGSRANNNVKPDYLQDFDIVYIVTELNSFICDHNWVNFLGHKLLWQLPDEMTFGTPENETGKNPIDFHYLMLFDDGNRIDLTLVLKDEIKTRYPDSLTIVWLDKDKLFLNMVGPTDFDYVIKTPAEEDFLDTCNEFWWVSTYVAKGLVRREITYVKEMLETIVRPMFMKIIEWYIGTQTDFSVSFGKGGKYMKNYLPETIFNKILFTYADSDVKNNWLALFAITELFGQLASAVADNLHFAYNKTEEMNAQLYLKKLYAAEK